MQKEITELLQVSLRALISLTTLFFVTKMLGKKQVSELSLFDYVIGISIGNFAAEMTINIESPFLHGTLAVVIFGLVAYLISVITMKSIVLRRFFMGIPTVIIENGILLEEGLKAVKFDINDLLEQCRAQGYFDISKINYAIMEANGQISILPKKLDSPLTGKDMNLKLKEEGICANVIIDGKYMKENIKHSSTSFDSLKKEITMKGLNVKDILLATIDNNKTLSIYKKNKQRPKEVLE